VFWKLIRQCRQIQLDLEQTAAPWTSVKALGTVELLSTFYAFVPELNHHRFWLETKNGILVLLKSSQHRSKPHFQKLRLKMVYRIFSNVSELRPRQNPVCAFLSPSMEKTMKKLKAEQLFYGFTGVFSPGGPNLYLHLLNHDHDKSLDAIRPKSF
jgi:uncharacterized protein YecE (DUF72 family)